jgi:hypothetical protein
MDKRLAIVEKQLDGVAPRQWVELFVKDIVQPIRDSIKGIEHSISELAKDGQEIYTAFKESIRKEEERKTQKYEDGRLPNVVKRWGAVAAAVGAIWFLFRIAGTLLEMWMKARGIQ